MLFKQMLVYVSKYTMKSLLLVNTKKSHSSENWPVCTPKKNLSKNSNFLV